MHACALIVTVLAVPALAQNVNTTYITGLLGALNGLGLTSLATVARSIANNTNGVALLAQLSQGSKTVFAPNNEAFGRVPSSVSSDVDLLTSILSYHVLDGRFNASDFATTPQHTIARTFLKSSNLVMLEANKSQVVVVERASNGSVAVLEPTTKAIVSQTAAYENLIVHVIDRVLIPPASIGQTVNAAGLSGLAGAVEATNLLSPLESARGITIFAPTNQAFNATLAALGPQAHNVSLISAVLANHVINGTSVYSTDLTSQSYASAGGQPFRFSSNSSGTYVTSGSASAKIVRADILVSNGVVHLIDAVLANAESNPAAAASAAASQASVAATATGIPGQTASGSGPAPSGSTSSNAGLRTVGALPGTAALLSVVATGAGALVGGMLIL
ncbi:hypothetical protein FRC06_005685 [Ceratobasidium sp. 370]|nr:hypothetical protein FRC06_005685 [Ceratobasidium sp. 370]